MARLQHKLKQKEEEQARQEQRRIEQLEKVDDDILIHQHTRELTMWEPVENNIYTGVLYTATRHIYPQRL